ncbi:MAG: zinc-dependent metalloprotease [Saprospiraceae bacterium]|nr:zinc-dependent metalloprotease [Saprospiraceae bacterium]
MLTGSHTRWLALLAGCLICTAMQGQYPCGTGITQVPPALQHLYTSEPGTFRSPVVDSVGVALHIIDPVQSAIPSLEEISTAFDLVNQHFAGAGLHFFICDLNIIEGNRSNTRQDLVQLNRTYYVDHRINVYLVGRLVGDSGLFLCGVSTFPWEAEPEERFNALSFDCFGDGHTLSHELGHYYGLLHTHDVSNGAELVDGSNCEVAGDLLCDTPADPVLGFHNVSECQYSGSERDAAGTPYEPDPTLIMSYTPAMCASRFTAQQLWVIRQFADASNTGLVADCQDLPDYRLSSSVNAMTTNFFATRPIPLTISGPVSTEGTIDITYWISADPGTRGQQLRRRTIDLSAEQLPLQYDLEFLIPPGRDDGLHYMTIKLDADRAYAESNEWNNEIVIEMTLVDASLNDLVVFPNPAEDELFVFRRFADVPGQVDLDIYTLDGRLVRHTSYDAQYDQFYIRMDIDFLPPGMYHLAMQSPDALVAPPRSFLFVKR